MQIVATHKKSASPSVAAALPLWGLTAIILMGLIGSVFSPWSIQQNNWLWIGDDLKALFLSGEAANAFTIIGKLPMPKAIAALGVIIALSLSLALALTLEKVRSGLPLALTAGAGFFWLIGWGFAISGEAGYGWGPLILGLLLIGLCGLGIARMGFFHGDTFVAIAVLGCVTLILLFIGLPVGKALANAFFSESGSFDIFGAFKRLATERVWGLGCLAGKGQCGVAWNTVFLGLMTATSTTILGFILALIAERGLGARSPIFEKLLRLLALLPIITPPFVVGLGLILFFGRAGLVNQLLESLFSIEPSRWFYGVQGVWLAQTFAFTPIAFLIIRGVLQGISPSLEEASQTLRATPTKTFFAVTMPLAKPGLLNAFLVGFIESLADFGNPIVLGGKYAVLSTEIFFSIVGAQLDLGKAASLGLLLTLFALGAFAAQRALLGKGSYTTVSGKGDAGISLPLPSSITRVINPIGFFWLAFTLLLYAFAIYGGFAKTWGRDYSPTLMHYVKVFDLQWGEHGLVWAGAAWNSFWTTVKLAAISAPLTAFVGLLMAYLISRPKFKGQSAFEFMTLLAFAIPGTVVGVSYVMAFNVPPIEITGTSIIIVLCFLFRNCPVGVRAGVAAFKQIDKSLDEASLMLNASTLSTLRKITLPLLKPALVAALVYSFVRATTTVSAVIFLVTAENELATTYIIGRVGNGDYGSALAYCTVLMVLLMSAIGLFQWLVGERKLKRRKAA
jgi:iron(III) transport system permease protein